MNRRDLIKAFAASASLTVAGRVWAAPYTDARLLVVFLRGAYDAANVIVPTSSEFYYASRPNLAIARPDAGNPTSNLVVHAAAVAKRKVKLYGSGKPPRKNRP